MATRVDRKTWVTIIDFLRFTTPVIGFLCFIISSLALYIVSDYSDRTQAQTKSLTGKIEAQGEQLIEINTKLAVVLERINNGLGETATNKEDIKNLRAEVGRNSADIRVLFAKAEK